MGKIITTVLALAAISSMAYYALHRTATDLVSRQPEATPSAPKQTLDNVRAKVKDIERKQDEQVADVEHRMNAEAGANGPADVP